MRLTCPACAAQYEVPDSAIPVHGRDVQCSVCNEIWFHAHPDTKSPLGEEKESKRAPQSGPSAETDLPSTGTDAISQSASSGATAPQQDEGTEQASEAQAEAPSISRKKLDPAVADVLREEAELEAQARRNEVAGAVENQPERGLGAAPMIQPHDGDSEIATTKASQTPLKTSRAAEPQDDRTGVSARNALPDIEEINSTLRSNGARSDADPGQIAQVERRAQRNWQRGFTFALLLAAVLVLIYAFAPQVAEVFPQSDPWLSAFVAQVDMARIWLDGYVQQFLALFDSDSASSKE